MKGVILAGGAGSRWLPCSRAVNKHLLPVFDRPMIYYPLALLMAAGIRDIVLVTSPADLPAFRGLLGDGAAVGIRLDYVEQPTPSGIGDAILHCEPRLRGQRFCVALGDNVFLGPDIAALLCAALEDEGAVIFACRTDRPEDYGVIELGPGGEVMGLEEKPRRPRSDWVVPGLYVYPPGAFELLRRLSPSPRGELEVSSLNQCFLEGGDLQVGRLSDDTEWFDLGTPWRLLQATNRLAGAHDHMGSPEAVAWRQGWLNDEDLRDIAIGMSGSHYGDYLRGLTVSPGRTE